MRLARAHVLIGVDDEARLAGVEEVIRSVRASLEEAGLTDEVQLVETGTLGISGHGVVLVVYPEGVYYGDVTPEQVPVIVEEHLLKGRLVESLRLPSATPAVRSAQVYQRQSRVVLRNCGVIDPGNIDEYVAAGGYEALGKALTEMSPEEVVAEVKDSGLRGRGGAGFPTGLKWELVRRASGEPKYVVCNADEGEPGTFKDRLILEGDPHKLVESMVLCGYACGAAQGFVYIRGEYTLSIDRIEKAIEQARGYGLLGEDIMDSGFAFDMEVRPGAGAYVCGEETSLLESLEGKRGWPRMRPPYPVTYGLWGKPTALNNVETLANVPDIITGGSGWYKGLGTASCSGTKVYTILGHVRFPGLVEVEMGTPLRTLVHDLGGGLPEGRTLKAVLVGGAAGAFVSPEALDVRMDYESLRDWTAALGSGAILVMDESACMVDMLGSVLRFFRHESCGQCVPCRAGTDRLVCLLEAIQDGSAPDGALEELERLAVVMQATSLCPLGQSLVLPVRTALNAFREEFVAHLEGRECPVCSRARQGAAL
ncbi:MAG: NADH-quinone oxidoreductase subunit NuoF [Candidatus Bipolaricaulota bacterium]